MLILGYVKEISKNDILIGLPNGLNGYIAVKEIQSYLAALNNEEDIDEENDNDEVWKMFFRDFSEVYAIHCASRNRTSVERNNQAGMFPGYFFSPFDDSFRIRLCNILDTREIFFSG